MTPGTANVHGFTGAPEPGRVRQHPAADAGVDVAADPARGGEAGERGDVVDHAMGVRRRAADHEHDVVAEPVEGGRGGVDVGAEVRPDRNLHRLDPEVVRRLVEGGVRGGRDDHPRPGDVGVGVAGGLDREQHRLGAARGDRADGGGGGVEQAGGEPDQLVLHPEQARERRRVEAVGAGVGRHRRPADPVGLGQPGVVDVGEAPPARDGQVGTLQLGEPREHVVHAIASTSSEVRVKRRSHHRLASVSTAGTIEQPSVIARSAPSPWSTPPSVLDS